jgi:pimeloyl-ACP methyl ester carboxylesterase
MTPEERKAYLDKMVELLPQVQSWTEWQQKTGALPPDFDALPKINTLPDPFLFLDGKRVVKTPEDWKARRAEIRELFEKYDIGRIPPKPKLDQIIPVSAEQAAAEAAARGGGRGFGRRGGARGPATAPGGDQQAAAPTTGPAGRGGALAARGRAGGRGGRGGGAAPGSVTKIVDLKYGPNSSITTRVTLTIPPGNGPFPVLMGGGANITSRGYIACSFPMSVDQPPAGVAEAYPDYDFHSMAQVAFTAQMVVDYLYTLPEVDKAHIAITGYSRGGKMAAITAMVEERIAAVLAGSTGVGGVLPWRSGSERGAAEGIESTTRSFPLWFAPQLRFFSGREDKLPIDGNLLTAMIAPRSILSFYGESDEVGNIYGNEQSYYSAQKVFDLLGASDHSGILHGVGHHGYNDQAETMRWLDIQFGKSNDKWENDFIYPWDYNKWAAAHKSDVDLSKFPQHNPNELASIKTKADLDARVAEVKKSVQWMLGDNTGGSAGADPQQRGRDDVVDWAIQRSGSFGWLEPEKSQTEYKSITFGNGTRGELYYPKGTAENAKLPTVVWLHGFSYPMGYMWVYRQRPDLHPILALTRAGYAVFAFDQTGHGSRQDEFATFFDRFPNWSRMGRMVSDTRAAIDAIQKDGMCDADKVYLFGYSMGGMIGLHTAAVDDRVKGVVSICGFTPMRTDTTDKGTGGLARYSVELPLLPRLGAFIGHESQLPYDYDELIATVAPRPVYVVAPQLDRDATPSDVHAAVEQARGVYTLLNAANKLELFEPWDYNRLPESTLDKVVDWMKLNMK